MVRAWGLLGLFILFFLSAVAQPDASTGEVSPIFSGFSCAQKNTANQVELKWQSHGTGSEDYFVVERSRDKGLYETVSVLRGAVSDSSYSLVDYAPASGVISYRIRFIPKKGEEVYSRPISVTLSGDIDFKFYPNPVDKLLIITTARAIEVQVFDGSGTVRVSQSLTPGLQVINLSSLERGTYVLRVGDRDSNRVISEQLVKN